MTGAALATLAGAAVMYLAYGCLGVVLVRSAIGVGQLAVAGFVFATRVKPSQFSLDLWHRYGDLALPVSVIVPAFRIVPYVSKRTAIGPAELMVAPALLFTVSERAERIASPLPLLAIDPLLVTVG